MDVAREKDDVAFTYVTATGVKVVYEKDYSSNRGSGGIPYKLEELKTCEVTGPPLGSLKYSIFKLFDAIKSARNIEKLFMQGYNAYLQTCINLLDMPVKFINIKEYLEPFALETSTEIEKSPNEMEMLYGIRGSWNLDSEATRLDVLKVIGDDTSLDSSTMVTMRNLLKTALVFLGMSNRISNKTPAERIEMLTCSQTKGTIDKLFPDSDPVLLKAMIKVASVSGFFDIIQVGTRWHTDCVIYNLCLRDSSIGTPLSGIFSFFMLGNVGYEFTAFSVIDGLASMFKVKPQNVLAMIPIEETIRMVTKLQEREADLTDPKSLYLLCHSLSTKFDHEFSMSAFKGIAYVCIYASAKLRDDKEDPDMNIPGLRGLTANAKELLDEIAERLYKNGVKGQNYVQFKRGGVVLNQEIESYMQSKRAASSRIKEVTPVKRAMDISSSDEDL